MALIEFKDLPDTSTPINSTNLNNNFKEVNNNVGDLTQLETASKDNVVNAVNELEEKTNKSTNTIITPLVGSNYNGFGNCYYYKKGNIVHIHIGVQGLQGNTEKTLYVMPEGLRPSHPVANVGVGANISIYCAVQVMINGNVLIRTKEQGYGLVDIEYEVI